MAELGELLNQVVKLREDLLEALQKFQELVLQLTHLQVEVEVEIFKQTDLQEDLVVEEIVINNVLQGQELLIKVLLEEQEVAQDQEAKLAAAVELQKLETPMVKETEEMVYQVQ